VWSDVTWCYQTPTSPERQNSRRKIIVFELLPFEIAAQPLDTAKVALSLDELRKRALEDASESVEAINRTSKTRDRSSSIRTYVLRRADGNCEGCDRRAPFETEEGSPYLEPHHIRRLSDGGPDHPEWVIALCPNCHARAHHAQDKKAFNNQLRQIVLKIEITK